MSLTFRKLQESVTFDSVDHALPLDEPWAHFSPDGGHNGGGSHADDLDIDLDGEFFRRYLFSLLNTSTEYV
jgi:hypothetical protein